MYELVEKAACERIKDELMQQPKTKEEINNPMKKDKKEELYNAIYCYDGQNNICGYNIQSELWKTIFTVQIYLPIIDSAWKGVKSPKDLPDKNRI